MSLSFRRPLSSRNSPCSLFQRRLDLAAGGTENLDTGKALAIGRHEVPWSVLLVRKRQHIAQGDLIGAAFSTVPPVLGIQLVPLVGRGLTLAEAPQLLVM